MYDFKVPNLHYGEDGGAKIGNTGGETDFVEDVMSSVHFNLRYHGAFVQLYPGS